MRVKQRRRGPAVVVQSHLGIITSIAFSTWRRLPASVLGSVGPEDVVQDLVVQVLHASGSYRPERGAASTFVHHVATNQARTILARYTARKRQAQVLEFSDPTLPECSAPPELLPRFVLARSGMEQVIAGASLELRRALADLFTGQLRSVRRFRPAVRAELRLLVRQFDVTASDFRVVMAVLS